jgi:MFS family permease
MKLAVMIALSLFAYAAMVGSRVTISITAIKLTDSTLITGTLVGLFSVLPIFLGLSAGRMVDRFGILRPLVGAVLVTLVGLLVPFLWPSVWTLAFSSAAIGAGFMMSALALTNAGALIGSVEQRTRNISWLFLGNSAGMALGPMLAGIGIDHIGHRGTFLMLAALPALSIVVLAFARHLLPGGQGSGKPPSGHLAESLRSPLLRALILSNVLISACLEVFYLFVPLHGTRVGVSASMIGVIMSSAFVANFTMRSLMPMLLRNLSEGTLLAVMFCVAGASIAPFALFSSPAMLMLLSAGVGLCHGVAVPILSSLIFTASPAGRQGEVAGVRAVLMSGTVGVAQVAAGGLSGLIGIAPVMALVAAATFGGAWFVRRGTHQAT